MLLLLMLEERIRNGWISEVWTAGSFSLCQEFTRIIDIPSYFSAKSNLTFWRRNYYFFNFSTPVYKM